jgi:tRNA A-37 threonylcarbamoyl transferase component Bud32
MSPLASDPDGALPPDVLRRIDLLCDRFEQAWARGQRPRPEDYRGQVADEHWPALLRHLLAAEIECRKGRGETPAAADYRDRFPEHARALYSLFPPAPPEAPTPPAPAGNAATAVLTPTTLAGPVAPPPVPGRYALRRLLGLGGIGEVWLGRDRDLRRQVAVKTLQQRHAGVGGLALRLEEEAQITGQLQHPNIPPVYEKGTLGDGRPYFCMKVVRGETLDELLKRRAGPAEDLEHFLGVFGQVCQAVAYAHSKGVIHRDLKPANVMVGAFGEVQVMDWGLAKVLPDEAPAAEDTAVAESVVETDRADRPGVLLTGVLGTYAYMPPEQARGEVARMGRSSDVFSLGAILCEVLTGRPPYVGTPEEVRTQAQVGFLHEAVRRLEGCGADSDVGAPVQGLPGGGTGGPAGQRGGGGAGGGGVPDRGAGAAAGGGTGANGGAGAGGGGQEDGGGRAGAGRGGPQDGSCGAAGATAGAGPVGGGAAPGSRRRQCSVVAPAAAAGGGCGGG